MSDKPKKDYTFKKYFIMEKQTDLNFKMQTNLLLHKQDLTSEKWARSPRKIL